MGEFNDRFRDVQNRQRAQAEVQRQQELEAQNMKAAQDARADIIWRPVLGRMLDIASEAAVILSARHAPTDHSIDVGHPTPPQKKSWRDWRDKPTSEPKLAVWKLRERVSSENPGAGKNPAPTSSRVEGVGLGTDGKVYGYYGGPSPYLPPPLKGSAYIADGLGFAHHAIQGIRGIEVYTFEYQNPYGPQDYRPPSPDIPVKDIDWVIARHPQTEAVVEQWKNDLTAFIMVRTTLR
jgi:hypothetical protein